MILTSTGALAPNYGAGTYIIEDVWSAPVISDETYVTGVGGRPEPPEGGDFCADVVIPALS